MKDRLVSRLSAVKELDDMYRVLEGDIQMCLRELESLEVSQDNTSRRQFWYRAMIRAHFALCEAIVFKMKNIAYEYRDVANFSAAEQMFLIDKEPFLKENGDIVIRTAKLPFISNLKFAFGAFARAFNIDVKPDYKGNRWQQFTSAIEIRDRLMHPKSLTDLSISGSDLEVFGAGGAWFLEIFTACTRASTAAITEEMARFGDAQS